MPAKSFLGETREAAHRFYAMTIRGEVSDENIQAYMRAASQIQEIWSQIDEQIVALQVQETPIWKAYAQYGYPLAFIRSARAYQIFVQELLAADSTFDPQTAGYLPRITYDQANALCYQMQATLHDAVASLHDPAYTPEVPFPLVLGPRIEKNDQPCPTTHFQGMIAAAREMREWAAGLIAQYDNAVTKTDIPIPPAISAHLSSLRGRLAQADSHLRFGTDMAGQASQGNTPQHLHEETENVLWNALQQYFLLNQAIAMPQFLHTLPTPIPPLSSAQPQPHRANVMRTYHDRSIRPDDLWRIASPSARQELRGTRFGTDEMQVKHLSSTYANNRRMIPPIPISLMCYNSGLVDPLVSLLEFPILLRQQLIPQYTTSIVSRFRCLLASNVLLCYTEGEGKASKRALMPRKKGSLTIF